MKNVILTHKELQANLFYSLTYGLMQADIGENLHIVYDVTDTDFIWKIVVHPTKESSAVAGRPIFFHHIHKGASMMNDVRLGVTVGYLREQAEKFLADFEKFKKGIPMGGTHPTFSFSEVVRQNLDPKLV